MRISKDALQKCNENDGELESKDKDTGQSFMLLSLDKYEELTRLTENIRRGRK